MTRILVEEKPALDELIHCEKATMLVIGGPVGLIPIATAAAATRIFDSKAYKDRARKNR